MSPERKLEAYLVKRCKEESLMTRKVQWIGHNGAPDRVIFGGQGKLAWVELKSLQGNTSVLQENEIGRMRVRGQNVYVARTTEDVESIVDHLLAPRVPDAHHPSDP
jgi:hypothetical protein